MSRPAALLDAAAELLGRVLRFDAPADGVVSAFFRERRTLGARDRRVLSQMVFRFLRERRLIELLAAADGDGGSVRHLAGIALDDERLDAIDRAALPEPLRHNLPDWLADALRAKVGDDEFWPLIQSLNVPAPLDLRVNALKAKRDAVRASLQEAGVESMPTPYSPWGLRVSGKPSLDALEVSRRGEIEVQDEGSQLIALLVDAHRGETVADFCAGAGGKTLALGAAMRGTGRLYAFDTSAHRLDALKARLARSGLANVHPMQVVDERDARLARLAGKVDRVLVDAPCSGLGTLRRNPDLKWRNSPGSIAEARRRQLAILAGAAMLPKPGGWLVYATCSLLTDENESVAREFAAAHPQFVHVPADDVLRRARVADATSLVRDGWLQLAPHRHGTDAFFAAVWQRR